jgi:hypothetical protein
VEGGRGEECGYGGHRILHLDRDGRGGKRGLGTLRAEFNKILGPEGVFLAARATRRREPQSHSVECGEACKWCQVLITPITLLLLFFYFVVDLVWLHKIFELQLEHLYLFMKHILITLIC